MNNSEKSAHVHCFICTFDYYFYITNKIIWVCFTRKYNFSFSIKKSIQFVTILCNSLSNLLAISEWKLFLHHFFSVYHKSLHMMSIWLLKRCFKRFIVTVTDLWRNCSFDLNCSMNQWIEFTEQINDSVTVNSLKLWMFERSLFCSPMLHLFNQKYSKILILWNIITI